MMCNVCVVVSYACVFGVQARANHLSSCVITIRIMRDMCQRVAAFKPLNNWTVELLCEKALASSFQPLGPGEAFRRVLETIASGIVLPGMVMLDLRLSFMSCVFLSLLFKYTTTASKASFVIYLRWARVIGSMRERKVRRKRLSDCARKGRCHGGRAGNFKVYLLWKSNFLYCSKENKEKKVVKWLCMESIKWEIFN